MLIPWLSLGLAGGAAAAPPVFTQTELLSGRDATFTVTGATPGVPVRVFGGAPAFGTGACPPALGGECLDLRFAVVLGSALADGSGSADVQVTLPALTGAYYGTQVVSVGPPVVKSYVVVAPVIVPATDIDLSQADAALLGEAADDYAGTSVAAGADVDGDGLDDVIVGAVENDGGGSTAGAAYVVSAPSGAASLGSALGRLQGGAVSDRAGAAVSAADLDGDGFAEVLVGASHTDTLGRFDNGTVYLVHGPVTGTSSLTAASTAQFHGAQSLDGPGMGVTTAGDLDGDFTPDVVIGVPAAHVGPNVRGTVYVVSSAVVGASDLGLAATRIRDSANSSFGSSVAVLDSDGDGMSDLLVGAPNASTAALNTNGAAYLFLGPISGQVFASATSAAQFDGEVASAQAGLAVDGLDFDGDGDDDVVVGSPQGSVDGRAYVVASPVSGARALSTAETIYDGEPGADTAGSAVARVADFDGDSADDLLIGAPGAAVPFQNDGAAYFVYGGDLGTVSLTLADLRIRTDGPTGGTQPLTGAEVASGDVDGDGLPDLVVATPYHDGAGANAGAVHVVLGSGI